METLNPTLPDTRPYDFEANAETRLSRPHLVSSHVAAAVAALRADVEREEREQRIGRFLLRCAARRMARAKLRARYTVVKGIE